jgi:uncharacterized protein
MQFSRENAGDAHAILACSGSEVRLRDRAVQGSVIVTRETVLEGWRPPAPEDLTLEDVVLLGTGDRQRLPPPALYAGFAARGIGLETMDNRAACRTYNVLLGEYRNVAVALILG